MFQHVTCLVDAYHVISSADDVTRLGIVSAAAIATGGLGGMLHALAAALRLPKVVQRLRARLRGRKTSARGSKRKPVAAPATQDAPRARRGGRRPPDARPARRRNATPKPAAPEPH
jgi:hypothetical protein